MEEQPLAPHYLYKELLSLLNRKLFDFMHETSLDGVWYWDLTQKQNMWISPRFWHSLGYRAQDMAHLTSEWKHVIHQEDIKSSMEKLKKHLQNPDIPYTQVVRYHHKNGTLVSMRTQAIAIRSKSGKPLRILALSNNLTTMIRLQKESREQKEQIQTLERRLAQEIRHDELTKLYNRKGLQEYTQYLIEVAKRDGLYLSVALISIDLTNQRQKRHTILKEFSKILNENTRQVDIIGRFEQEIFMLVMPNTNQEGALNVAQRLRECIEEYPNEDIARIKIHMGLATKELNTSDKTQNAFDTLNLWVDESLYLAKKEQYQDTIHYQIHNQY